MGALSWLTLTIAGRRCQQALAGAVEYCLPGGDHEIIVGRVRDVETSEGSEPLVYWRGDYVSIEQP